MKLLAKKLGGEEPLFDAFTNIIDKRYSKLFTMFQDNAAAIQ